MVFIRKCFAYCVLRIAYCVLGCTIAWRRLRSPIDEIGVLLSFASFRSLQKIANNENKP
jgi:hypothetical protein